VNTLPVLESTMGGSTIAAPDVKAMLVEPRHGGAPLAQAPLVLPASRT
jgi:hypothetical protein